MNMVGGPTSEADERLPLHRGWIDTPRPSPHDLSFHQTARFVSDEGDGRRSKIAWSSYKTLYIKYRLNSNTAKRYRLG